MFFDGVDLAEVYELFCPCLSANTRAEAFPIQCFLPGPTYVEMESFSAVHMASVYCLFPALFQETDFGANLRHTTAWPTGPKIQSSFLLALMWWSPARKLPKPPSTFPPVIGTGPKRLGVSFTRWYAACCASN